MSYTVGTGITGGNMVYSRQEVINAISRASRNSGVDFSYLLNQAGAESNFDAQAKAKTSSATGLYQFIDSTWLNMVERYGERYGIETNGKSKQEILDMRKDPQKSSFMAAAFASENEKFLNANWGGEVGATELYFAHFLGAGGAASFLKARDENPMQNAADLFPNAALTNRNVFFDPDSGKPRCLQEVYAFFDKKFDGGDASGSEALLADAGSPGPPSTPMKKLAALASNENGTNSLYSPSRSLSDSIIMQRAQALREAAQSRSTYAKALYRDNEEKSLLDKARSERSSVFKKSGTQNNNKIGSPQVDQGPLSGLLAQPLDLMMLTQTSVPTKVIDDNS